MYVCVYVYMCIRVVKIFFLRSLCFSIEYLIFSLFSDHGISFLIKWWKWSHKWAEAWGKMGSKSSIFLGGGGGRADEKLRKPSIYRKFIDFLISILRYEIKIVHL